MLSPVRELQVVDFQAGADQSGYANEYSSRLVITNYGLRPNQGCRRFGPNWE